MILYPDNKFLFIHIPKNGGALLYQYGVLNNKNHEMLRETHDFLTDEEYKIYKNWKIITIVRNSYERIVSLYRFRCMIRKTDKFKNFEDFVLNFNFKEELFNQLRYITIDDKIIANQIIMYDKDNLIHEVAKLFGDKTYTTPNKDDKTHYYGKYNFKRYYTNKARKEVEKICEKEIELFKFQF